MMISGKKWDGAVEKLVVVGYADLEYFYGQGKVSCPQMEWDLLLRKSAYAPL